MIPLKITYPQQTGLVSIVIPTFNKDQYIRATLDSISAQTFENWEVLVVEDSSCGQTESIVRAFAKRHPRNRVVYSRNERNYGAPIRGMSGSPKRKESSSRWSTPTIAGCRITWRRPYVNCRLTSATLSTPLSSWWKMRRTESWGIGVRPPKIVKIFPVPCWTGAF